MVDVSFEDLAMKELVIIGAGSYAELAQYYFEESGQYNVLAFSVTEEHLSSNTFKKLPLVNFSNIKDLYPPSRCEIFVAIGYKSLNRERERLFFEVKSQGYHCPSYVSPRATVLNDGRIGENCLILEENTIQPFASIGDNVVMWSGNHLGHHSVVENSVFISSHVVISGNCRIDERCFLGVNSTIRDGVVVGHDSMIGAGSLILKDVEAYGVYSGPETVRSKVPSTRLRGI